MTLKQKVYNFYLHVVNDKLRQLQQVLADLKESGSNETKSTAGDKHETALAMLQIEQANVGAQLKDVLEKKAALVKINLSLSSSKIVNGSLVKTDKGYLFISIALGKATIDGYSVIALSPQSPLGQKLMGLSTGDVAAINNNTHVIEAIE
jgi:transcription elongation GreA/GreB family factor